MDNNKIQKISHYIIVLLLVILSLASAMIYSFCRKKYFPMQKDCKTEKFVCTFLIILLFLRLLFLKN